MTTNNAEPVFNPLRKKLLEFNVVDQNGDIHPTLMTEHWTTIHPTWTADWVMKIWEIEKEIGHGICGWPTNDGNPCKNYPLLEENIFNVSMVGKCGLHANPPPPKPEPEEMVINEYPNIVPVDEAGLPATPSFKMLSEIAEEIYTRCMHCHYRRRCDKYGDNDGVCIREKAIFTDLMGDIVNKYNLVDAVDKINAFTLITSFIDFIKTHIYETHYGSESTMREGMMALRLQLNRLILQNMRNLGVDRKFRLVIRKGDERHLAEKSLAEMLADKSLGAIESKSMTVTQVRKLPRPKEQTFIGVDGRPVVDADYADQDE